MNQVSTAKYNIYQSKKCLPLEEQRSLSAGPNSLSEVEDSLSEVEDSLSEVEDSLLEVEDSIIIEEPLEIAIKHRQGGEYTTDPLMVTMRTPGDDEALIKGILFSEGIIQSSAEILNIEFTGSNKGKYGIDNSVIVTLNDGHTLNLNQLYRNFVVNSGCGVCGKGTINALDIAYEPVIDKEYPQIEQRLFCQLPDLIKEQQLLFAETGGVHASALIDCDGNIIKIAEDVGRHNALDKVIGHTKEIIDPKRHFIFCSGRISFELVQKVLLANIGMIVGIGAPSSLAIDLAERFNVSVFGFIKENRFNVYSGHWRLKNVSNEPIEKVVDHV